MTTVIEPLRFSLSSDPLAPARPSGPPLAPLLAGARARGVADGLEWLGLAAVLLDDRGEVLHANAGAVELMEGELYLEADRLRARDAQADQALNVVISEALLSGAQGNHSLSIESGQGALNLRMSTINALDDDPFQLLRLVVLLERRDSQASASRH